MTENGELATAFVARIAPQLKVAGFRKRRNAFNRTMSGGLVHVLSLQLGPYDPSGMRAATDLVPDLHGTFTLNLGVYSPSITRRGARGEGKWINEYDCQFQWRLGGLIERGEDRWWELRSPTQLDEAAIAVLGPGLERLALFPDAQSILNTFESPRRADLGWFDGWLDISELYVSEGDRSTAETLIREHALSVRRDYPAGSGYRAYLVEYFRGAGWHDIVAIVE